MFNEVSPRTPGKIAVATDDSRNIAGHVGRCKSFLIFETNGKEIVNKEVRENIFTHHHQHQEEHNHGEHHQHGHQTLIDGLKDCEVLIFNHGGWRLIEDIKAHNITPILTDEKLAEDAVLKYLKGELINNEENVCRGHHH
jgi:predicted Fe-Mo cluster-binding NifX family protein